jgi:Mg-chelatase subunit ChlD
MEACDVDCALSEWSVWGPCTQRCGTEGAQKREKTVTAAAVGEGKCFEWDDLLRREFQACAVVPCAEAPEATGAAGAATVTPTDPNLGFHMCDRARMDLILLLDASGSVKDEELTAEKALLMGVLEHMEVSASTTEVAVAAYAAEAVRVVEFGAGFEDIQRAVTGFGRLPPAGSDFAQALGAANRMMEERTADEDRPTTIVLFADGRDNAARRANLASRALRSQGVRIVAVAAGLPENVAEVASRPGYANVIAAPTFAEVDPVAVARKVCPPPTQPSPVLAATAADA